MTNRIILVAVLLAGCASEDDPMYTADCLGLVETDAYACLEQRFWPAFQVDIADRIPLYDDYEAVLEEHASFDAPTERAWAVFRRAQLAMAIAIEETADDTLPYIASVVPDFERVEELDPDNFIVVSWKASMEIAVAHVTGNDARAVELFEEAVERIEQDPLGNVPSISGISMGLPLSTGVPQRTAELADDWECQGVAWCDENTAHGPRVMPGMSYHWAELYARVGRRDDAIFHLEAAIAAPGYDDWQYRYVVEEAIGDVDAFLGKFEALGEDGSAFDIAYANQSYGCVFCHAP